MNVLLRSATVPAVLGTVLFSSAGTLDWPNAWWFVALFLACNVATNAWLARADPALARARTTSPVGKSQVGTDRAIAGAILLVLLAWLVFAALDAARFRWSDVPAWASVAGAACFVLGFAGRAWALGWNTFAGVAVRVQAERGQTVVQSGPYRAVRHRMYGFMILSLLGTPILLGSAWSLLGLGALVPLVALRAVREEAVLVEALDGYREYREEVPYRLVPGIW